MATQKIEVIPDKAIINLEVSGYFYKQLQQLLVATSQTKPINELKIVLDKIAKNGKYENLFEAQVHILTALIVSIEKAAKAQDKVQSVDFEPEPSQS